VSFFASATVIARAQRSAGRQPTTDAARNSAEMELVIALGMQSNATAAVTDEIVHRRPRARL
jgi:hypothetical protein